jgi:hypothetical protein
MVSGNTITIINFGAGGGDGILLEEGSSQNMIRSNTIESVVSGFFGIDIQSGATDNSIKSNTVTGGLYDGNGPPCVNSWENNTFSFASGAVACIH